MPTAEKGSLPAGGARSQHDLTRAEGLLRSASLLLARGNFGDGVRALHEEVSRELERPLEVASAQCLSGREAEDQHRRLVDELRRRRRQIPLATGFPALLPQLSQWAAWAIVVSVTAGLVLRYQYAIFEGWRWAHQHPEGAWISRFYGQHNFKDFQVLRYDVAIDYDWGRGSPAGVMDRDHFSASWDTCVIASAEVNLTLNLYADDAGKVLIDDAQKIHVRRAGSKAAKVTLTPGVHHVRVEYDERRRGAKVVLSGLDFAGTDNYRFQRPRLIGDDARCEAHAPP